jgi:uncharacterized surface protein with fasciclin (FAS1) repeats
LLFLLILIVAAFWGFSNETISGVLNFYLEGDLMREKSHVKVVVLVLLSTAVICLQVGCKDSGDISAPVSQKDLVDTAVAAGDFTTLVTAIKAADLVETLKGRGPFTVFAPTDEAFAKLPAGTIDSLLKPESRQKLASILTYHVVSGRVMASDVVKLSEAKTVNGQSLSIKTVGGVVMVDSARVIKTDIKCSNGVIHVIDGVVLPK